MDSVLIISPNQKATDYLTAFFKAAIPSRIVTVASGGEARRMLDTGDLDLVLIYTPLPDEFGAELSVFCAERGCGVMLVVKAEMADDISAKVEDAGVFVIPKPINKIFLHQALKLLTAAHNRMLRLNRENNKLQSKIDEIRMVDRAKCLLIERKNYSEMEAHRLIEKAAMDRRISRQEVAEEILAEFHIC